MYFFYIFTFFKKISKLFNFFCLFKFFFFQFFDLGCPCSQPLKKKYCTHIKKQDKKKWQSAAAQTVI